MPGDVVLAVANHAWDQGTPGDVVLVAANSLQPRGHAGSCSLWVPSRLRSRNPDAGGVFFFLPYIKELHSRVQNEVNRDLFCIMKDTPVYSLELLQHSFLYI